MRQFFVAVAFAVAAICAAQITLAQTPVRIISLLPSLTETVCALGRCAALVAVDRYSNYPPQVQALPKLGGGLDPNIEAIVAAKPDLVLLAPSAQLSQRLQALGLKTLALEPQTQAQAKFAYLQIGQTLGVQDSPAQWAKLEAQVATAAGKLSKNALGKRVYFEVDDAPYAASESSFIGELLTQLRLRNIVAGKLGTFPKLNPEFIVRAQPDVIMLSAERTAALPSRPGWAGVTAITDKKVCAFTAAESEVLIRPGPRMGQAAEIIVACLNRLFP